LESGRSIKFCGEKALTKDDVIKMAREAEGQEIFADPEEGRALFYMDMESLERFAQLVAAQAAAEEREACAKYIERQRVMVMDPLQMRTADQVAQGQKQMCKFLAAAIRARGTA
jgi:hypothetical protein